MEFTQTNLQSLTILLFLVTPTFLFQALLWQSINDVYSRSDGLRISIIDGIEEVAQILKMFKPQKTT